MTVPETADVVIIGGGIMGASAAYHLARSGCPRVVLLERDRFFGSEATGKCAGGVRYQFDTAINIQLSLLSLPMLDRFEDELGQAIDRRRCGYLFILTCERDVAEFQRQVILQNQLGVPTCWLDGEEIRRRLPVMHYPDALGGTWGPDDGLADPGSLVQGYIRGARRLGATGLGGVTVTGIATAHGRVRAVETDQGTIEAPAVVNAAGPWAGQIGRMAGVEVPVVPVRRQIAVLGAIDELEGFYCITGFSGHGFMHGPACGLLLAEEILHGAATTLDISSLRMSRFRTGVGMREYNVV